MLVCGGGGLVACLWLFILLAEAANVWHGMLVIYNKWFLNHLGLNDDTHPNDYPALGLLVAVYKKQP